MRTRVEYLVEALEWCLDHQINIANLSLGTANPDHAPRFAAFLAKANFTVVAAAGSLPGSLPGVLAADLDAACARDRYCYREGRFFTSGHPRPIPGVPPERNLQGISFAVANMSGFAARLGARDPDELRRLLIAGGTEI